ncbi:MULTISPECIES: LCP family protein [unclassified Paenibacillus]|uniref:LCP family protein n=1 Tax=Paenibacillus TaxID=44249 RepID=UPI00038F426B|nr:MULTISPECIES: LCP family protein [unclassified Paenibacillus]CDN41511.1 Transcriptional regulator LytR [Paenibacillus sp. P22]
MKPKKSRARKAWTWTASVLAVLLVLGTVGYFNRTTLALWGFDMFLSKKVEKQLEGSYQPTVDSKPPAANPVKYQKADPYSVLLLGVDARGAEQGRSDTMMFTVVRPSDGAILMVSMPRDTYTEIVGKDKKDKITHAYAFGGAKMAVDTVENLLGNQVDYYAAVNFEGFRNLIDAMGGIPLPVEKDLVNKEADHEKFVVKAGQSKYNGTDALNFVRYREDAGGDISRTERQQAFVESIMDEASSVSSWTRIPEFVGIMGKNFATDIPPSEMIDKAKAMLQSGNRAIYTHTLKGEGHKLSENGAWYYFADEKDVEASRKLIADWMNKSLTMEQLTGAASKDSETLDAASGSTNDARSESGKGPEVTTASSDENQ